MYTCLCAAPRVPAAHTPAAPTASLRFRHHLFIPQAENAITTAPAPKAGPLKDPDGSCSASQGNHVQQTPGNFSWI